MTPAEKLIKQQKANVRRTVNGLLSQFSFGNIKTWRDVYRRTGYSDEYIRTNFPPEKLNSSVCIADVRSWCKKLEDDIDAKAAGVVEVNPPAPVVPATPIVKPAIPTDLLKPVVNLSPPIVDDESGFSNENDYGLHPSPNEKAFLFWFQKKATKELYVKVVVEGKSGVLLLASTGTGKTFITGALDRRLKDIEFHKGKTWGITEYMHITRSSVVEQTKRVNKRFFNIDHPTGTEVLNIESLRARAGEMWIKTYTTVEQGEEVEKYQWKPMMNPCVVYLDECQAIKNPGTKQHNIMLEYSKITSPTTQVFISATPFTRVSEAKAFAISTKKDISDIVGIPNTTLSESTWPTYAAAIAAPSSPDEYNEAAVERLMKDLDDYIVRVKGVRWQFNAKNHVEIIDFDSDSIRAEYDMAWQKYLERKAKLEEAVTDNPRFQAMIELGTFLKAAEYCKRYIFAERMYKAVTQEGKAAVLAVKYKQTIIAVTKILHEKYGVSRDNISLIWGGGQTQLTARQKLKAKIREKQELFEAQGITMEDMGLEDVEDKILEELPEHLRLGNQTKEERQKEIDKFQCGRSLYCIYTYKAGGVGLSVHHTDEYTTYKVRRHKNGYAVIEDIPNVPTRPRKVIVGPTWSPIELVQGCGRAPRLTSLSDTEQIFLYYRGTVEEEQAFVVTHRLKCLSKVVRQWENWQDLIVNHTKAKEIAKALVKETEHLETEEPTTEIAVSIEEED